MVQVITTRKIFEYNGSPITFHNDIGGTKINATEMAKPFGKMPKDWLVNKQTQDFLAALSGVRGIPLTELAAVNQGGTNQGTWLHEDAALEFARWLAPEFAIWCNDRIKELLTKGHTELQPLSQLEVLQQAISIMVEQERRTKALEAAQAATCERLKLLEAKQQTSPDYFTVVGYASYIGVKLPFETAQRVGRQAAAICRKNAIGTGACRDARFGQVKTYPKDVLAELLVKL